MATDATGTPTSLGIPTYNTSVDAPSGLGFNATMAIINTLLGAGFTTASPADGDVPVWDNTAGRWKRSTDKNPTLLGQVSAPSGLIAPFGGSSAPAGWLLCDGTSYATASYSNLFNAIGYVYGGSGSTFNVPDLRGRTPAGYAASGGHADVSTLGNNDGVALANRRPKHNHTNGLTLPNHGHGISDPGHGHGVSDPGHGHGFDYNNNSGDGVGNYPANWSGIGLNTLADAGMGTAVQSGTTGVSVNGNTTGISVGNPTSNPAIPGTVGPGGTTAVDAMAWLVLNFLIKT